MTRSLLRCTSCGAPLYGRRPVCTSCRGERLVDAAVLIVAIAVIAGLLAFVAAAQDGPACHTARPPVPAGELGPASRRVLEQMVQLEGHADHDAAAVLWTLAHRRDRLWHSEHWPLTAVAVEYSRVLRGEVPLSPRMQHILGEAPTPDDVARLVELWCEGLVADPCERPTLHWGAPRLRAPHDSHGHAMVPVDCGPTDNLFWAEAP